MVHTSCVSKDPSLPPVEMNKTKSSESGNAPFHVMLPLVLRIYNNNVVELCLVAMNCTEIEISTVKSVNCFAREESRSLDNTRALRETHFLHRLQKTSLIVFRKKEKNNMKSN